ncbi:MAG TPA: hypothetical protein VF041_22070 [Gemmatimonadaceae bacterium]
MRSRCILATCLLLLAACGGDSGPTSPGGVKDSYSATVSGDTHHDMKGHAIFAVNSGVGFALELPDTLQGTIYFEQEQGAPGTGKIQLADASSGQVSSGSMWGVVVLAPPLGAAEGVLYSQSGTLEITSQTSTEMKGNFTFTAVGTLNGVSGEATVTVTGSFDARNGSVTMPSGRVTITRE